MGRRVRLYYTKKDDVPDYVWQYGSKEGSKKCWIETSTWSRQETKDGGGRNDSCLALAYQVEHLGSNGSNGDESGFWDDSCGFDLWHSKTHEGPSRKQLNESRAQKRWPRKRWTLELLGCGGGGSRFRKQSIWEKGRWLETNMESPEECGRVGGGDYQREGDECSEQREKFQGGGTSQQDQMWVGQGKSMRVGIGGHWWPLGVRSLEVSAKKPDYRWAKTGQWEKSDQECRLQEIVLG